MAVYKRHYKPYSGALTPEWLRWFAPARYAMGQLFESRLVVGFLVACYVFPVASGFAIYMRHNASVLTMLNLNADRIIAIDGNFFAAFLSMQAVFSFLLTAYAAPGLVAPDLANNALQLYLCRPISRAEYVLGKLAVLLVPLSLITWVPGLLLWIMQAGLDEKGWGANNLQLAAGVFFGAWLWIGVVALAGLALSAWVRWKIAASAALFGVFFVTSALSAIVNEVMDTKLGYLLNPGHLIGVLWANLLGVSPNQSLLGEMFDIRRADDVPQWAAWLMLAAACAACIWILDRKLRGREVVS